MDDLFEPGKNAEAPDLRTEIERPGTMEMTVQAGMIRSLGIKLYTNIGKVLVEFIANAYDSDSPGVDITIPADRIQDARKELREQATKARDEQREARADKMEGADASQPRAKKDFEILTQILPEDIEVTIVDHGHGMSWQEVQNKFLPVHRERRKDEKGEESRLTTPNGRYVMGRKGVGKLAGFGAALTVIVRTTRKGEDYATTITLSDENLNHATNMSDIEIPVTYEEGVDPEEEGTVITLKRIKSDSVQYGLETLKKTIFRSFHAIRAEDFEIRINDEPLPIRAPDYEMIYPAALTLDDIRDGRLATDEIEVEDIDNIPIRYYVGFMPRGESLVSDERGARIYCNNRLAAGPSLFDLDTGMHSFHSSDYLECVVEADDLDRDAIDLINTARTNFMEGNEVVEALRAKVTKIMKEAIKEHGRFRQQEARKELETDPTAQIIMRTVSVLPAKSKKAATRLLTTVAAQWAVGTKEFEELAPIITHSINAGEVLARLVSKGTSPETIGQILEQLRDLSEIEKRDTLKLYRGRRGAIEKLEKLKEEGEQNWNRRAFEKKLHELLKECPWLIQPEFSNYIASDQKLTTTVTLLAKAIGVDDFAPQPPPVMEDEEQEDTTRPDLAFVLTDPMMDGPHTVKIVELKSTSLPLRIQHYRQLEDYIEKVRMWCENNLPNMPRINGYLIGAMPKMDTGNAAQKQLLRKFREAGPKEDIQIIGMTEMIRNARVVHIEAIKALENDLADEGDDDADEEFIEPADDAVADAQPQPQPQKTGRRAGAH